MRLIDADALEKFLKQLRRELPKESRDSFTRDTMILNFQQYVHMQPTIDAEPVVHGEWVTTRTIIHDGELHCSLCRQEALAECGRHTYIKSNYCPNCGAKMEVEP